VKGVQSRGGRQWRWNFNGVGYGRWKHGTVDDGVQLFSEGERGRRQGGSTVPEANDTTKSGAVAGEAEGGNWRLEVEDE
jgi:hypothetical protein